MGKDGITSGNLYILFGGAIWIDTGLTLINGESYWAAIEVNTGVTGGTAGSPAFADLPEYYLLVTTATTSYGDRGPQPTIYTPSATLTIGGAGTFNVTIDEVAYYLDTPIQKRFDDNWYAAHDEAAMKPEEGTVRKSAFFIPEFPMDNAATPRETIDAANSFHDWVWKVNHDPTITYDPKPTAAVYEIGQWSGAEFEDAAANSGEEIYNEVRVEANDALGRPLVSRRGGLQPSTQVGFTNPSFASATTGWTGVSGSTIARDTGTFDTTPASLSVSANSGYWAIAQSTSFYGKFVPGRKYRIRGRFRRGAVANTEMYIYMENTSTGEIVQKIVPRGTLNVWFTETLDFSFTAYDTLQFQVWQSTSATSGTGLYIDSFEIWEQDETSLPARLGFTRTKILPVQAAMVQTAIDQIGDIYLAGHKSTPFKGTLVHSAPNGIRRATTGDSVHPAAMLNATAEKIRFTNRVDPDTGHWGREGLISTVGYDDSTGQATIAIDNTRSSFETLLTRLAAIIGT
jgi:hypothetical protein